MKKFLIILLIGVCGALTAQNNQSSYNIKRALDAAQSGNEQDALKFLVKETKENPTNGYAYLFLASICNELGYNSAVLRFGNDAIRYLGKTEPNMTAGVAEKMAEVYLAGGDTVRALSMYDRCAEISKYYKGTYTGRAWIYYKNGKYDDMFAEGEKFAKLYPKSLIGYVIMSDAKTGMRGYMDALNLADKAYARLEEKDENEHLVRGSRAKALFGLGRYEESLNEAVRSANLHITSSVLQLIEDMADSVPGPMVLDTLQAVWERDKQQTTWLYVMSDIYRSRNDYINTALMLHKALAIEENNSAKESLSNLYINYLASPEEGERLLLDILKTDSANVPVYIELIQLYHDMDRYDDALKSADKCMQLAQKDKDVATCLMLRGRVYEYMHDYRHAVDDYFRYLIYKPENHDLWFRIGRVLRLSGDTVGAEKVFEEGKRAMMVDNGELTAEALLELGEYDKATEAVEQRLQKSKSRPSERYNAACVYAMAGRSSEALRELEAAFEYGFRNFYHIVWDSDLDNLRALPEFNALVNKYKEKAEEEKILLRKLVADL